MYKEAQNNRRALPMRALLLSSLITLVGSTYAQTTDSEPPVKENSKDEVLALNTMVITGVAKPTEKIESSVAISTFSDTLMERLNPQSVTELVWSIPGFHPEDSGGEVGNNITPRGFPLTRQNDFVALQKDGMTVLYDQAVLFSTADRFTRVSNFIEQTEAIRGGTSSIYMGSSPAGYINFLSREGSQTAHGDVSIETNSASRAGFEGWVSGPLSERTTYALGGWYRADNSGTEPLQF